MITDSLDDFSVTRHDACSREVRSVAVKGVFEISGNSRYDDLITERYHFPSQYLPQARQLENDWILYRETRVSGGRMAYIATAFVERIDPDEADPTH